MSVDDSELVCVCVPVLEGVFEGVAVCECVCEELAAWDGVLEEVAACEGVCEGVAACDGVPLEVPDGVWACVSLSDRVDVWLGDLVCVKVRLSEPNDVAVWLDVELEVPSPPPPPPPPPEQL